MAPSRDRLLHFGFKATVSDRGRELGGREGCLQASGEQVTRSWGRGQRLRFCAGGCVACLPAEGGEGDKGQKRGPAQSAVLLYSPSPVREHARTRTHPTDPFSTRTGTSLPRLLPMG